MRFSIYIVLIGGACLFFYSYRIIFYENTSINEYYRDKCDDVIFLLQQTEWGNASRGKKILNSYNRNEIFFVSPSPIKTKHKTIYAIQHDDLEGGGSAVFYIYNNGVKKEYKIYIGLYHISNIREENLKDYYIYGATAIHKAELVHVLIDELLSRAQKGQYFIEGRASNEEEVDAWNASEQAVLLLYGRRYQFGRNYPTYGANNSDYKVLE